MTMSLPLHPKQRASWHHCQRHRWQENLTSTIESSSLWIEIAEVKETALICTWLVMFLHRCMFLYFIYYNVI